MTTELTKDEAYVVAGFIDSFIFDAIRSDLDWDSFQNLRILVHAYELNDRAEMVGRSTERRSEMRKWIVAVMLVALLMAGCAKTETAESHGVFDASMFTTIETQGDWKIVADRKTGVMYAVSAGAYNRGTFTVLVDSDGEPLIYDGGDSDGKVD